MLQFFFETNKKGLAHNTDGIIHKLVTVFAFTPTPLTD